MRTNVIFYRGRGDFDLDVERLCNKGDGARPGGHLHDGDRGVTNTPVCSISISLLTVFSGF